MRRAFILAASSLRAFLDAVRGSMVLVAPVMTDGGTLFAPVAAAADVVLDAANTTLSLKGVFLPQRELLCSFRHGAVDGVPPAGRGEASATVVFGARPCDARAMVWMDAVFSSGGERKQDPSSLARRRATTIITLACDDPCPSCFCTSVGGSPYGTEGADVLASRAGAGASAAEGDLLLEALTEKGEQLLRQHAGLLTAAAPEQVAARPERAAAAAARMPMLDFSGVKEKMDAAFDSIGWEAITRSCLGCGACTYVCPTCHCFDVTDEARGDRGVRIRTWDGCQYALFTLHASGHNPRPNRRARMRQRLMHKYSYAVETAGAVFCSGCGRCVRACPVNLDIREMLTAVRGLV